ncbi:hypothetical protein [Pedobacter antarcticus]|uniref:hypothetical protein n=1 Tax=Pedobacter antarcticus TaxID=34086 RepID=UPI001C58FEE9|nr:hypothetical protein [Pedobacter antarcticus]
MTFRKNISRGTNCSTLIVVGVLAVSGIVMALKYAYDSGPKAKKRKGNNGDRLQEDLREKVRDHASQLLPRGKQHSPVRHTIKSDLPKSRQLPPDPDNYDPQF